MAKAARGCAAWLAALACAACCVAASAASFKLDSSSAREIDSHGDAVRRIVDAATREHAGETYDAVAGLCDRFGHRLLGSAALSEATDYLLHQLSASGLQNVHFEESEPVAGWTRGNESATLLSPLLGGGRAHQLRVLALGRSVGTPEGGISAPVVVARDWAELDALGAKGRLAQQIVLLNPPWRGYGETVAYRVEGAARAAQHGAAAVLVRSVGPFSLANAHTGIGSDGSATPIPAASIATEDADLLARMAARGWDVRVKLELGCHDTEAQPSRVVIAELPGTDLAHEIVLLSGHLDSWDVGFGALDDGAGVAVSWRALALLSRLGLRPRRTLRFAAWAGEEFGVGSASYWKAHADEAGNVTLAAESDSGVFAPAALQLSAPVAAHAVARRVGALLQRAGAVGEVRPGGEGADVEPAAQLGVPVASLATRANAWFNDAAARNASATPRFQGDYFFYHHSHADTPSLLDSGQLDSALATWASFAYVIANLSVPLPRGPPATAAQLAAELGERNALHPPPICAADWQPPSSGGGDDAGPASGMSAAQVVLLALTAAAAGAGTAWAFLVPFGGATGHRGGAVHGSTQPRVWAQPSARSGGGVERAVPAAPYQRLADVEEEEVAGTAPRARQGGAGMA